MRRRREGMSTFAVGAIALIVIAVATFLGFTKSIPFRSHYEVKAAFRTANNIKPNSPVRIAGVEVGRVTSVEPTSRGANSAVVTMRIGDGGKPIHRDATATIRPRIFLEGNFFVDLRPGSPSQPELDDGDTIPAAQTDTPVQFDQVLAALKRPTVADLRLTLGELAKAYDAGLAKSFRATLEDQAPAFRFSAIVLEGMLGRRPRDLSGVVRDLGAVSAALDRSPPRLRSLLTNFNVFAGSLAREQDALGETIDELPRTLAAAGPALDALNAAFPPTRRLAREALPGVRSSGPTIAALRPLVSELRGLAAPDELRGLTADLRATTPGLTRLARGSVPLLGEMRRLASCTNEVLVPWGNDRLEDENFPATGLVHEEAIKWTPALAGESRSHDANGQWFKVLGSGGLETFQIGEGFGTSALPINGTNPPPPAGRPPLRPDVDCETQPTPDLRTKVGPGPRRVAVDWSDPRVKARSARARATAIEWLEGVMKDSGSDVEVLDTDITRAQVEALARRTGNLGQLDWLKRRLKTR